MSNRPEWDRWVEKIADAAGNIATPETKRAFADAVLRSVGTSGPRGYQLQTLPRRLRDVQAKSAAALAAFRDLRAEIDAGIYNGRANENVVDLIKRHSDVTPSRRQQSWSDELAGIDALLAGIESAAVELSEQHRKRRGRSAVATIEIAGQIVILWHEHFPNDPPKPSQHGQVRNGATGPRTRFDKVCDVIDELYASWGRKTRLGSTTRRRAVTMARKIPM